MYIYLRLTKIHVYIPIYVCVCTDVVYIINLIVLLLLIYNINQGLNATNVTICGQRASRLAYVSVAEIIHLFRRPLRRGGRGATDSKNIRKMKNKYF